jgi:CheY-like chemotaxis protein
MSIPLVYLIDDDDVSHLINQKILNHYLRTRLPVNARLLSFSSAVTALDYLRDAITGEQWSELPEVIFLDISMPILGGWEFLDKLNELLADTPAHLWNDKLRVYILTSSNSPMDKSRSTDYPMVRKYIEKPLHTDLLTQLHIFE